MTGRRLLIHAAFVLLLPLIVAIWGVGPLGAALLVLVALAWRWAIALSAIVLPAKVPELQLDTISASHFVEKVRWCMDRLGLDYVEKPAGGTLGVFFLGRTVPRLRFVTGAVRSEIGNSPEILRYLWGRYAVERGEAARFLEPTAERLEWERRIDRAGVDLQVWVYSHILDHRELTQRAWGCESPDIPAWQRTALRLLYPLLRTLIRRAFRIRPGSREKAVARIDVVLDEAEACLGDGRGALSGGADIDYADLGFAAIMGLWHQPAGYGGGRADAVRLEAAELPEGMAADQARWRERYPLATAHIDRCYAQRGGPATA